MSASADFAFEAWLISGDIASKIEVRLVDRRFRTPLYYRVDDYILFEPKAEKVEEWLEYWREVASRLGLELLVEEEVTSALNALRDANRPS